MGATTFACRAKGKTAKDAFRSAVAQAQYDHGHSGYTGIIAEKRDFTMIDVPKGVEPNDHANALIDNDDPRVTDKWGPAGCVKLPNGHYLFFGWASC